MISYDKKMRHLIVASGEVVTFDIQLRGRINVVRGAAATGKTYMCTLIRTGSHQPDVVNNKRGCKKSSQEKRLRSCQKARQQSFFVV